MERLNKTLIGISRAYVADHQKDWDHWIPLALMAYRTAKQASTQESPFRLMFGRNPRTPVDVAFDVEPPPAQLATDYAQKLVEQQRP